MLMYDDSAYKLGYKTPTLSSDINNGDFQPDSVPLTVSWTHFLRSPQQHRAMNTLVPIIQGTRACGMCGSDRCTYMCDGCKTAFCGNVCLSRYSDMHKYICRRQRRIRRLRCINAEYADTDEVDEFVGVKQATGSSAKREKGGDGGDDGDDDGTKNLPTFVPITLRDIRVLWTEAEWLHGFSTTKLIPSIPSAVTPATFVKLREHRALSNLIDVLSRDRTVYIETITSKPERHTSLRPPSERKRRKTLPRVSTSPTPPVVEEEEEEEEEEGGGTPPTTTTTTTVAPVAVSAQIECARNFYEMLVLMIAQSMYITFRSHVALHRRLSAAYTNTYKDIESGLLTEVPSNMRFDGIMLARAESTMRCVHDAAVETKFRLKGIENKEFDAAFKRADASNAHDCFDMADSVLRALNDIDTHLIECETIKSELCDIMCTFIFEGASGIGTDCRNVIITGEAGTGKSTVARTVARLFGELGMYPLTLRPPGFVQRDRTALVGEFLGSTGIKTRTFLSEAVGSVAMIDEAYSIVRAGTDDQYGAEALDIITGTVETNRLVSCLIFAGYPDLMDDFFMINEGLKRRFPIALHTTPISPVGLYAAIVRDTLCAYGYSIDDPAGAGTALLALVRYIHTNTTFFKSQNVEGAAFIGSNLRRAAAIRRIEQIPKLGHAQCETHEIVADDVYAAARVVFPALVVVEHANELREKRRADIAALRRGAGVAVARPEPTQSGLLAEEEEKSRRHGRRSPVLDMPNGSDTFVEAVKAATKLAENSPNVVIKIAVPDKTACRMDLEKFISRAAPTFTHTKAPGTDQPPSRMEWRAEEEEGAAMYPAESEFVKFVRQIDEEEFAARMAAQTKKKAKRNPTLKRRGQEEAEEEEAEEAGEEEEEEKEEEEEEEGIEPSTEANVVYGNPVAWMQLPIKTRIGDEYGWVYALGENIADPYLMAKHGYPGGHETFGARATKLREKEAAKLWQLMSISSRIEEVSDKEIVSVRRALHAALIEDSLLRAPKMDLYTEILEALGNASKIAARKVMTTSAIRAEIRALSRKYKHM
jgi:hypothetical protein